MIDRPAPERRRAWRRRSRALVLFSLILSVQFAIFEAALRVWGSSEAAPSFQALFEGDPVIGYRLRPHSRMRFRTSEFEADIAINGLGVRDGEEIGPKPPSERRVVILGDSLVLSVQVPFEQTFGELLEARLNAKSDGPVYRVINAGVQGYGPVEEWLFYKSLAEALQPDLVLTAVFVGNDAEEAVQSARKLQPGGGGVADVFSESLTVRLRRLVRRSMVLQILRLRVVTAAERMAPTAPPEPPLQSYAARPASRIAEGIELTRQVVAQIVDRTSALGGRSAVVLVPARFQLDDADYGRLKDAVAQTGGELVRDAATDRFRRGLSSLDVPMLDLLPPMRAAQPGPDLFYQETVHFTPHGHQVVARALDAFIAEHALLAEVHPRPHAGGSSR